MRTRPKATKLNHTECAILARAAKTAGVTESEFIRDAILQAADEQVPSTTVSGFKSYRPSARLEAAMGTLRSALQGATDEALGEFLDRIGVPKPHEPA